LRFEFGLHTNRSLKHLSICLFACAIAITVAGCKQSPFVGMPTPMPEQVVLAPSGNVPMPDFGPRTFAQQYEAPGEAPPQQEASERSPTEPAFAWSETENILILGTDRRPYDSSWRTDTIMVVGIDRERERVAVLSIPRDLYIDIPNYGYGRINQADYIGERVNRVDGGGPALVSEVLSQTFGIETQHWIRFEMTGFQSVVDAVGGVDLHLECPFWEPIYNLDTGAWEYFTLPAGDVHLDGESAYWYVRLRLKESDIGRSNRQREFLWAMRDRVLSDNLLLRFPELWKAFRNSFSTDLSFVQIAELIRFGISLDPDNVRASGITLKELDSHITEAGASVLIITDPAKPQGVVDNIWDAPAMMDANRKSPEKCAPIPTGSPVIPTQVVSPVATAPATVSSQEASGPQDTAGAQDAAGSQGNAETQAEGSAQAGGAPQNDDRQSGESQSGDGG
jgi:LCP family protein required for cell wall assembly